MTSCTTKVFCLFFLKFQHVFFFFFLSRDVSHEVWRPWLAHSHSQVWVWERAAVRQTLQVTGSRVTEKRCGQVCPEWDRSVSEKAQLFVSCFEVELKNQVIKRPRLHSCACAVTAAPETLSWTQYKAAGKSALSISLWRSLSSFKIIQSSLIISGFTTCLTFVTF